VCGGQAGAKCSKLSAISACGLLQKNGQRSASAARHLPGGNPISRATLAARAQDRPLDRYEQDALPCWENKAEHLRSRMRFEAQTTALALEPAEAMHREPVSWIRLFPKPLLADQASGLAALFDLACSRGGGQSAGFGRWASRDAPANRFSGHEPDQAWRAKPRRAARGSPATR